MARDKSPAFQFYPDSWLSSRDVELMGPAGEGAYIRLLCYAWLEEDCGLPTDDEELAQLSRLGSKEWNGKVGQRVKSKFREEGGRLFNDRLLDERKKQTEWSEKSSRGGRRSAERRANQKATVVEPPLQANGNRTVALCLEPNPNTPSPSPSPSPDTTTDASSSPLWTAFERIAERYPNRVEVDLAAQLWLSYADTEQITEDALPEIEAGLKRWLESDQWTRDDGRYVPSLAKWIRDKRWLDHPPASAETKVARRGAKKSSEGVDPNAEWVAPWKQKDVA